MFDVPERPLSYGEVLNQFRQHYTRKVYITNQKRKQQRQKKKELVRRHEYSYDQVMQKLKDILNED